MRRMLLAGSHFLVLGMALLAPPAAATAQEPAPPPRQIEPDSTLDVDAPIGPPDDPNAVLERIYLSPAVVSFEIDYPGSPHTGANQVMRLIAIYRTLQADGSYQEKKWNVSGSADWTFSDPDVYDIVPGEFGNFADDGLLVSWTWGPDCAGTTGVTVTYQGLTTLGSIAATDSRP